MLKVPQYVEVKIFGEDYKLVSKYDDKERVTKIADLIDDKMQDLLKRFPSYSKEKIAILTSLNLADELFKTKAEVELIEKRLQSIIEFMDNSIPDMP